MLQADCTGAPMSSIYHMRKTNQSHELWTVSQSTLIEESKLSFKKTTLKMKFSAKKNTSMKIN